MPNDATTRTAKLRDIPLIKRLAESGIVLDSELAFTRAADGPDSAVLSSIVLPQRSLVTLVTRCDDERVVGQIRLKPSEHLAQIVYIAPPPEEPAHDTAWLQILDAMAEQAGKRGAHVLAAEVDESSQLFVTMRTAGFAVYARQEIWRRLPGQGPLKVEPAPLVVETDADTMDIQLLYCNIVPRLVQQIAVPSSDSTGLVYRQGNRIQGYIALSEGKNGIYVVPYLHPDIHFHEVSAILASAVTRSSNAARLPVFVCMRRYQDWLSDSLIELGFERYAEQAVMVKHIAAGIRQASFAPLPHKLEAVSSPVRPPTSQAQVTEQIVEISLQE
ncbi:MAG: hypothetical protein DIU68_016660 [Chloroflexota bacterium]|nr:MAG: hypothetical protein DIU68_10675 [Chloroflexota bacterium]